MSDGRSGGGRARRGIQPTECVCPKCGYKTEKTVGMPCRQVKCPNCDIPLMGE